MFVLRVFSFFSSPLFISLELINFIFKKQNSRAQGKMMQAARAGQRIR